MTINELAEKVMSKGGVAVPKGNSQVIYSGYIPSVRVVARLLKEFGFDAKAKANDPYVIAYKETSYRLFVLQLEKTQSDIDAMRQAMQSY